MLRLLILIYVVCFGTYVLFTREPDYFDAEFCNGTVVENNQIRYTVGGVNYTLNANYLFIKLPNGSTQKIIYNSSKPKLAHVYNWWGYWVRWQEVLVSVVVLGLLFFLAAAITKNPTPEALLQQLAPDTVQRKYS